MAKPGPPRDGHADRRLLPREDPGRRFTDRAKIGVLGDSHPDERSSGPTPLVHLLTLFVFFVGGLVAVAAGNARFAPLLFNPYAVQDVARQLATGKSYATFDLNIESRSLRRTHIASLRETPDVAVLGASHWQEGHADLVPEANFYNAHVHRDYYEDMLSVTEMFVRNNRLPKTMIITIRDNLFTPVKDRTDFLWVPTIPDYRAMASRLDIPLRPITELVPLPQIRQAISLVILRANIQRWVSAPVLPHLTQSRKHETLDILLPDGSIIWARKHDELFSREYARGRALAFAAQRRNDPPMIDPQGVAEFERLLQFLRDRGVEVYLAHPPFNPIYYDSLQGSPYMDGLAEVEALTARLANRFGLKVVGSFNPHYVGCRAEMYIDAEHSNPECLQLVLNGYRELAFSAPSIELSKGR